MTALDEKVWFITGCSSGFGRLLAEAALRRGDKVAMTARDPAKLRDLVVHYPGRARAIKLDVTRAGEAPRAIQEAVDAFKTIDVLVNNAAYGVIGAIEEVSSDRYRLLFETNVFGLIEVTRAALPVMRQRRGGRIVNFSSVGGIIGRAGFGIYNSSKFAVEGLSEALAQEVAPFGLAVIIVEPGPFRTNFLTSSIVPEEQKLPEYEQTSGMAREYVRSQSGKQEGDPERAVKVILRTIDSATPPLRLALGKDAYPRIRAKLAQIARDLDDWEDLGSTTNFAA